MRLVLILFFVTLLSYAAYEAQGIFFGPVINIPTTLLTVDESATLIRGQVERITELRLNGKTIPVTENGSFEELYLLAPGSNRLILQARDARGRSTQKTLDIVYTPKPGALLTPVVSTSTNTSSSTGEISPATVDDE